MKRLPILLLLAALLLSGCGQTAPPVSYPCRVVLEEGEGFSCSDPVQVVSRGSDVSFYITPLEGYEITGSDYPRTELTQSRETGMVVTLRAVRYSTVVTLTAEQSGTALSYYPNDGSGREPTVLTVTASHLRRNTATAIFTREGHTLLGWNTMPDGSGTAVGLGSRIDPALGDRLYAQWQPWSDPALFRWEVSGGSATITAYLGTEETAAVPAELEGVPVTAIASGAFRDAPCSVLVLPDSLHSVAENALEGMDLSHLYLCDNIRSIPDPGCRVRTLHINAAELPVYSGTYYDTFQDKYDRLLQLRNEKKLILFSGSSTRFGYDSALLAEAFPDYAIVNMGVFAYTNAMPQLELILGCIRPGDILLHMPEFDTSDTQFCISTDLDAPFFNMMESNYDAVAALDLRGYSNIFPALEAYLTAKDSMVKKAYRISPADYDEDGNPVSTPSYNRYGDYTVYRPNASSALPVYGMPVPYTVAAFPEDPYILSLNRVYEKFLEAGAEVFFTYAPRNALALSEASTPEARAALDAYFREKLCVPVLTDLEDSLWSGVYLYGTDNHLSTEGAVLHTQRIIEALKARLDAGGKEDPHG